MFFMPELLIAAVRNCVTGSAHAKVLIVNSKNQQLLNFDNV